MQVIAILFRTEGRWNYYKDTGTRKIEEVAKLLEIQLLDHIILTKEKSYSFADEGMI